MRGRWYNNCPFSAVSLFGVGCLADTFPSFPFSVSFPLMFQDFWSLLTVFVHLNFGLPTGRFPSTFISTTALMFSVSSHLLLCPNHSDILLGSFSWPSLSVPPLFPPTSPYFPGVPIGIVHRNILISIVAIRFSSLT